MDIKKLVLGTAQFGMDYGISNNRGKIPKDEVYSILNECIKNGIDTLDTAYIYGESEAMIGDFIKDSGNGFKIISKLPTCNPIEVKHIFNSSLERLKLDTLYGYKIHNFKDYEKNPQIWEILEALKSERMIKKIGFSLYFPHELEYLLAKGLKIDMIQVPYNIFDQRFKEYFEDLKKNNIEIYVRSVFLQGLFYKDISELSSYFLKIRNKMESLHKLSKKTNIPIVALCLNFAILDDSIDKIIIGIDCVENLRDIMGSFGYSLMVENLLNELYAFREDDERILIPSKWPKD